MRDSTPAAPAAATDLPTNEAVTELAILQQAHALDDARLTQTNPYCLQPDPIPRDWILEGTPTARRRQLVGSSDNLASTHMWDCSAGRFNWYYGSDETIYVLEGSVIVQDEAGKKRRLDAGDTFLFPAGSRFHWTVPQYIRKLAFLHAPLSRKMRMVKGIYNFLKSPFKRQQPATTWTG